MANKYWVGGGSSTNWNATGNTNWSNTDGGANNASVPANGDDVFLKSSAGCAVNVNTASLKSFNMTGYTGTLSGTLGIILIPETGSGTVICLFAGTVTWTGKLYLDPIGTTIINFTSGGKILKGIDSVSADSNSGTVYQQDALTLTNDFNPYRTNWVTNGYSISCIDFTAGTKGVINFTNSTITISGNLTGKANYVTTGSTILMTGSSKNFSGTSTYNIVTFSGDSGTISGNNTFTTLNVNTAGLSTGLNFTINSIQTVTNFTTNGYADNLAKILSTSAGSHFHLTTASDQISVDYMSIKDCIADQENTWYAGTHSNNVSGNSGWVFNSPPVLKRPIVQFRPRV